MFDPRPDRARPDAGLLAALRPDPAPVAVAPDPIVLAAQALIAACASGDLAAINAALFRVVRLWAERRPVALGPGTLMAGPVATPLDRKAVHDAWMHGVSADLGDRAVRNADGFVTLGVDVQADDALDGGFVVYAGPEHPLVGHHKPHFVLSSLVDMRARFDALLTTRETP